MRALNDAVMKGFGGRAALSAPARNPVRSMGSLRRYTLVLLRWGAVAGQMLALLIVGFGLGFDYPILPCLAVIAASVIVNIAVTAFLPLDRRVGDFEAFMQLGFDTWQLSGLLWLTGGISNPFSILFLAPVVTAATTLSRRVLFSLSGMALFLSLSLLFTSLPLPWYPDRELELDFIFRAGMWMAIIVGSIFTSLYAWRATKESRKMAAALAAAERMLAQEQKMSALGGMAAAAAHELGTPLATIQLTAKEMMREIPKETPLSEDAALVLSQAQRCRDILESLSIRGDEGDVIHDVLSPEDVLEEAAEPFIALGKDLVIHTEGEGPAPKLQRHPELLYAFKNYIENAVSFADDTVTLSARWNDSVLYFSIDDDGPGFDPSLKGRLGQPYATTRHNDSGAGGLGLGMFISATLIERLGGFVRYGESVNGGAQIQAEFPRSALQEQLIDIAPTHTAAPT